MLLLLLTDPVISRQSKFKDDETDVIKNLALEKVHRQRTLRVYCFRAFGETFF